MKPLTHEWVEKAEADLLTAGREYRARKSPNFDAVCFHAQQAVEKYMKAVLQENGMLIPRIHSLADLLALIAKHNASYLSTQMDAMLLEGYGVQFRYPGLSANRVEAKAALDAAERICKFVRQTLDR